MTAPLAHSVDDACARLGIARTALYALMASGELRSFKIGRRRLIPEVELQRYIEKAMRENDQ